jgi:hypothetical protein
VSFGVSRSVNPAPETIDPTVRAMLTDMIEVECAPFRDALSGMLQLWMVENSVPANNVDPPVVAFDKALRIGNVNKARLPVAVTMALYALDYKWPEG